jgi:hypothetical protein
MNVQQHEAWSYSTREACSYSKREALTPGDRDGIDAISFSARYHSPMRRKLRLRSRFANRVSTLRRAALHRAPPFNNRQA